MELPGLRDPLWTTLKPALALALVLALLVAWLVLNLYLMNQQPTLPSP
jgi:hypothetical protein